MAKLVIGAFRTRKEANEAILELEEAGVQLEDFSVIAQEDTEKTAGSITKKIASGGAAVGSATGGLAGLIASAVATAGMFVAGPVVLLAGLGWAALATVTGSAVGAAAGGIVGALVGLGIPEDAARHQAAVIRSGGVLLGTEDKELSDYEIRQCFEEYGAEQIAIIEHATIPARLATVTVS